MLALAHDTAALIEPLARRRRLAFSVELPDGAEPVETDANKVRRIPFNLLGNTMKFTAGGAVRLRLSIAAGGATFEVHDTGDGEARSRSS